MYSLRTVALAVVVSVTACIIGCSGPSSPAAPSKPAQANVSVDPPKATSDSGTPPASYPNTGETGPSVIGFPPRNEPNAFFQDLTALYRDYLRRPQTSATYVDPEGENVWLTEYFRFYLNGCSHQQAVSRTLTEIISGGTQPVCGQETPSFPPRNLPNEFQGQLEITYRDALRRGQILSYVDSEGANVWLAQYLRFRVSGCSHALAESKVFTEIRGGGVQSDCSSAGGSFTLLYDAYANVSSGGGATTIFFQGQAGRTIRITLSAAGAMEPYGYLEPPDGTASYVPPNGGTRNGQNTADVVLTGTTGQVSYTVFDGNNVGGSVRVQIWQVG